MGDMCGTDINLPVHNFTEANASSNNPTQYSDFSTNVNKSRKRRRQPNFLTKKNNQQLNSRVSLVDLTGNLGQIVNRRIPIIDLTDEDVMGVTNQIQCIDLTNDYSLSNNHPIPRFELKRKFDSSSNRYSDCHSELTKTDDSLSTCHPKRHLDPTRNGNYSNNSFRNYHYERTSNGKSSSNNHLINPFELRRNDGSSSNIHPSQHFEVTENNDPSSNRYPNHPFEINRNGRGIGYSSESFNFANQDSEILIPNEPSSDLTCYNDEFTNYRMSDMQHDNGQNIAHHLQFTDLADAKQQCNVNYSIPSTTLAYDISQSIEQNIPPIHLTSRLNYPNCSQPIFDPPSDNADNIVHNSEGLNLTAQFTQSSDTIQNDTAVREPIDIAGMYDAQVSSCNNLLNNCSKRATEIKPRIPFETSRHAVTELNILKCNETPNMHFMQISGTQQQQCKKEIVSENSHPQTKCYHQKDLKPGKYVEISEMNTLDLLKPAGRPVLFRHSLGRSTVNTSKNVPIESTGVSKGRSRTMTVSSMIRLKKAKSSGGNPKQNLPNSFINFRSQVPEKAHFPLELLKNFA